MELLKSIFRFVVGIAVLLLLGYLLSFCRIRDTGDIHVGRVGWADRY